MGKRGIPVEQQGQVPVRSATRYSQTVPVPGIVYANQPSDAGDTLGALGEIPAPLSGIVHGAMLFDRADNGLSITVTLFKARVVLAADDAAWALDDVGVLQKIGVLRFTVFDDDGNCQTSELTGLCIPFEAPEERIYFGVKAVGATSVVSGTEPMLRLAFLPDDPDWRA